MNIVFLMLWLRFLFKYLKKVFCFFIVCAMIYKNKFANL